MTEQAFNAIIEGTFADDWSNFHHKLASLDIPAGIRMLSEGQEGRYTHYVLYGIILPNRDPYKVIMETSPAEIVKPLSDLEGIVLPYAGGSFPHVLDRPRAVYLRDGRVFVECDMLKNDEYLDAILSSKEVERVTREFCDPNLEDLYRTAIIAQDPVSLAAGTLA